MRSIGSRFHQGLKNRALLLLEELEPRQLLNNGVPRADHVVLVILENKEYNAIIGNSQAPYINSLANQGALMTSSYGVEHPSEPNYLDLFAGRDFGVLFDPCCLSLTAPNLGSELFAAGDTFLSYSESMAYPGFTGANSGGAKGYYRNGNPGMQFTNITPTDNQPFQGYFPTDFTQLPTFSYVVPNEADSGHSGSIATMDAWLKTNLDPYVQWAKTNNSVMILQWDEGYPFNHIPTIFVGGPIKQGSYSETITHYNVLRTIEDMYGLPYAGSSSTSSPITDIWNTSQRPSSLIVHTPGRSLGSAASLELQMGSHSSLGLSLLPTNLLHPTKPVDSEWSEVSFKATAAYPSTKSLLTRTSGATQKGPLGDWAPFQNDPNLFGDLT
jgi:hypothetical protein